MEILSIIPARSGSTRVKNKNIRLLGGKPLLYYTIIASLKSNVSRTVLSTDDPKIAQLGKKYGAEVPFLRPKKFATFKASSLSVITHCLNYLKKENYFPDYVVFLSPTSPFRTYKDINIAIKKIMNSSANSLIGISKVTLHPFFMFKKSKTNALIEYVKQKNKVLRSQDVTPLYNMVDAIVITKTSYFEKTSRNQAIFDWKSVIGFDMTPLHSLDIDTEFDFHIVSNLFSVFHRELKNL